MTPDPHDAAIARYVDGKADVARRYAQHRPQEAEMHLNTARVLDALGDEIRMGLWGNDNADGS